MLPTGLSWHEENEMKSVKIWMSALVLAACACADAAPVRIGVLDLGLGAGSGRGPFGCPSDPAVFVEALSPLGEVFTLSGEEVARK